MQTSTYTKCRREAREFVARAAEMFDIYDAKGRAIGYRCSIVAEMWVTDPDAMTGWKAEYLDRPIWVVSPHATRDGRDYGAILADKICLSEEDARATAAKMIAAYRKRMTKQFA